MKTTWMSWILIVLLLAFVSDATADEFMCGSRIVATGDRKSEVLSRCGGPTYVEAWQEVRIKGDLGSRLTETELGLHRLPLLVKELVTVEEWEYNQGPNRFVRYLLFENGRLIRITDGDYGY